MPTPQAYLKVDWDLGRPLLICLRLGLLVECLPPGRRNLLRLLFVQRRCSLRTLDSVTLRHVAGYDSMCDTHDITFTEIVPCEVDAISLRQRRDDSLVVSVKFRLCDVHGRF